MCVCVLRGVLRDCGIFCVTLFTLRKHVYSNILKILQTKMDNFQIKKSDIFHISAQNINCGYSLNRLVEAVLTSTHNICSI